MDMRIHKLPFIIYIQASKWARLLFECSAYIYNDGVDLVKTKRAGYNFVDTNDNGILNIEFMDIRHEFARTKFFGCQM